MGGRKKERKNFLNQKYDNEVRLPTLIPEFQDMICIMRPQLEFREENISGFNVRIMWEKKVKISGFHLNLTVFHWIQKSGGKK